jgi:hypothetical protein
MIDKVFEELTILGFISFCLTVLIQAGTVVVAAAAVAVAAAVVVVVVVLNSSPSASLCSSKPVL